ncbi:hypothetical protein JCM3765_001035 [Sporobolomyces pararoseus]
METYASESLDTVLTWFSGANRQFFPPRCNPLGFTDVDAYCAASTAQVCCGLCVNQSVAGLGQFAWACITYFLTAIGWNLAPSEIFGLGILQVLNANAFIGSGWIRVKLGAEKGGMTRWHTKFLFPQALGCIAIMGATVFAPQWMRLGRSETSIEEEVRREKGLQARRSDVRAKEKTILKVSHRRWSTAVLIFWFSNLTIWTILFFWFSHADIKYSQANCESEIHQTFGPDIAAIILGVVAWILFFADCFVVWKESGLSDWLLDQFWNKEDCLALEHRRRERALTRIMTGAFYTLWFLVNLLVYDDGQESFLLSGADIWSFGQVEQMTALFPDILGFAIAWMSFLRSRDELEQVRMKHRFHKEEQVESISSEHTLLPATPQGGPLDVEIDQKSLWGSMTRRSTRPVDADRPQSGEGPVHRQNTEETFVEHDLESSRKRRAKAIRKKPMSIDL